MQQKSSAKTEKMKNIIIIALAVLLVAALIIRGVTGSSDGEVAAEYVTSGTISTTIRGEGVVASNASVDVSSEESGLVVSVAVQEGDEVHTGDVLVECTDYAASTAEALQTELDGLVLKYQLALIDQSGGTNSKEQLAIEKAQTELERAKADCEENLVTDAQMKAAKDAVDACEKAVADKEDEIARYEALGASSSVSLADAEAALQKVMLVHSENYNILVTTANTWMNRDGLTAEERAESRDAYIDAVAQYYKNEITELKAELSSAGNPETIYALQSRIDALKTIVDTYDIIKPAQDKVNAAKSASALVTAKEELVTLNRRKTNADTALSDLKDKRAAWQTASDSLEAKRQAVDAAVEALADAQTADQKNDLTLKADAEKIDSKRAELAELTNNGEAVQIKSKVNGIVTSVLTAPGSSAEADTPLITIEVPDMGYTIGVPVTRKQSALAAVGDPAVATLGDEMQDAVLQEIGSYPEDPSKQLLTFKLNGAALAGAEMSVTLSKTNEEYDLLVPPAALREDSGGNFVLTVSPKRGLFGTRYVITRVPVEVIARDDISVAVSGELSAGNMVVTTNPCAFKTGDVVDIA